MVAYLLKSVLHGHIERICIRNDALDAFDLQIRSALLQQSHTISVATMLGNHPNVPQSSQVPPHLQRGYQTDQFARGSISQLP